VTRRTKAKSKLRLKLVFQQPRGKKEFPMFFQKLGAHPLMGKLLLFTLSPFPFGNIFIVRTL